MDKYISILKKYWPEAFMPNEIKAIDLSAQELHALRYEVARQVVSEYKDYCESTMTRKRKRGQLVLPVDFDDWLAEQGETITIGRDK